MIEKTLLDFLNIVADYPVYMEIPQNPPTRFYILEKTGGSQTNHICNSTFVIQSYAESLYEASLMNDAIKDIMIYQSIENDEIASVKLNSNYNFTDSTTKRYRYQAVFDITHY